MTVEDEIIRQIDMRKRATKAASAEKRFERKEVTPVMERAHTRAKQIFCDRAYAIQAPDFFSVYGEKAVKADMLEVIARRKRWNEKHTDYDRVTDQMSTVLEAVILVHSKKATGSAVLIQKRHLLGMTTKIKRTCLPNGFRQKVVPCLSPLPSM